MFDWVYSMRAQGSKQHRRRTNDCKTWTSARTKAGALTLVGLTERERWSGSQRLFTPDRPIQGFHEENCKQNQWGLTRTGRQEHNKIFLQSSNATDYQELCKQLLLYFQNLYFFDDRVCERTCLFLGGKEFIEIISFDHFCAHLYDKKYGESW